MIKVWSNNFAQTALENHWKIWKSVVTILFGMDKQNNNNMDERLFVTWDPGWHLPTVEQCINTSWSCHTGTEPLALDDDFLLEKQFRREPACNETL